MPRPVQPKVLVVNDDPASLLALTSLLETWTDELGYKLIAASSGQDALRQVLLHDFAVILLDVNMPGMSGFETADAIQQHPRSAGVPIIFITAYQADEISRLKAYERGAADFLFTPFVPQVLRAKISVFIVLWRKNEELQDQTAKLVQQTTQLTEINSRLVREMEERATLEQQSHAKDEFLATLGHELRNPLSAIASAVSLLGTSLATAEVRARAHEIVRRQTRLLRSLVDDLLDVSRSISGKIVIHRRPLDLAELVGTCLTTFASSGRLSSHEISHDLQSCWVDADPARMEQVTSNLLDNAIKYTPSGGTIHVSVAKIGDEVVLSVSDNGIGIPADLLPKIFDLFVQDPTSRDHSCGGLGIGLSLVRRVIELHGGVVEVRSAGHGCGSTFTAHLRAVQPNITVKPHPTIERAITCVSVLVIDDHHDGREMLSLALSGRGYQVSQTACGTRGIELATAYLPEAAVVDIGLPGIDGYEVARRLRQNHATSHMRLIALTGYGLAKDQARALEAGFDLHMIKPVDVDKLATELSRLCTIAQ